MLTLRGIAATVLIICFSSVAGAFGLFPIGAPVPPATPILDLIPCLGSGCSAGSSAFRLRTAYNGSAIRLQNTQSSVTQHLDIGFVGNVIDSASADAFAALADPGTNTICTIEYDQSGNGNNRTQSGNNLIWLPASSPEPLSNPRSCVNSQQAQGWWNLPAGSSLNEDAASVAILARLTTSFPDHPIGLFGFGINGSHTFANLFVATTGGSSHQGSADGAQMNFLNNASTVYPFGFVESGPATYLATLSSTQACLTVNDKTYSCQTKPTIGATVTGGLIYQLFDNTLTAAGGIDGYADIFWDKTLSSGEQASVTAWGNQVLGKPQNVSKKLVTMCDSISESFGDVDILPPNTSGTTSTNRNYAFEVWRLLNHPLRLWNDATDGSTITAHISSVARDTAIINSGDIVLIMCGTNDTGDIPTGLSTLATDLHNVGAVVFCSTLFANSGRSSGTTSTINASITGGVSGCDHIIDTWNPATSLVGSTLGNTADTTLFFDGAHPTAKAHAITAGGIAGQYAAAINAVFP